MAWDGNGVFNRNNGQFTGPTTWEQDKNAGVKITTDHHDAHDEDLADGIQLCLTEDGQNVPTTALNYSAFPMLIGAPTVGGHALNRTTGDARYPRLTADNTFTDQTITIVDTSAGALSATRLVLYRNSTTPADDDKLMRILIKGNTTAGVSAEYASLESFIVEASASGTGGWELGALVDGALASIIGISKGVVIGAPTGSYQGVGTLNIDTALFLDGVQYSSPANTPSLTANNDFNSNELSNYRVPEVTVTGASYTFLSGDSGSIVRFTSTTAVSATLGANMPAGIIIGVRQVGAGTVTFNAASGATLRSRPSHTDTAGQFAEVGISVDTRTTADAVWFLSGDTAA